MQRVAICALTYLRPKGLAALLQGLDALSTTDGLTLRIVIVDNDPERSAEASVVGHAETSKHDVCYVAEPARGISQARNAAVAVARSWDADWIAFIDDDEWPDQLWLVELLATAARTGGDIISGPVESRFEVEPPPWVATGGFFKERRHEHDAPMRYARTSSVLIRADELDGIEGPFDPAFGLSGGEDTHLFAQMRERGCKLVWSDTAVVYETVPASRLTASWVLKREYRRGQTLGLTLRHRNASPARLAARAGRGVLELGSGMVDTAIGVFRGRGPALRGVHRMYFGVGVLTGVVGYRHNEYQTTHGS